MKNSKITILMIWFFAAFLSLSANFAQAQNDQSNNIDAPTKFTFVPEAVVMVANVEELYAAVNNPANAGNQIVLAPGFYMLSATNAGGAARPNGGRLELQENMALRGLAGNREAVIIDAANLPASSYTTPIANTGVIRAGKGANSIEWLTVRNASSGGAGVIVHLTGAGSAYVRIAHIASYNNPRGIDVRNVAAATGTYALELEIVDNELYDNTRIATGAGIRIINNGGGSGTNILASLSGNRSYRNIFGFFTENIGSSNNSNITIFSSGDRFYENGAGAVVGGALGVSGNGNTTNFTAVGTVIENNNGGAFFVDRGGLISFGGENTTNPNGMQNNTANVVLRNCRLSNNQLGDLQVFGARSTPATVGSPGTGNFAKVRLYGTLIPTSLVSQTIPDNTGAANTAVVVRNPATPNFDFDGDGRADVAVFRPSERVWYLNRSTQGFAAAQFGLETDKLAPADYDGDGKTDIAVFREGTWYWLNSSNNHFRGIQFGLADDIPRPADFDGDGRAEIAVWRPSNGVWYVFNLATNQFKSIQLGTTGDKPFAGDFDGDGLADYAVFRPSDRTWIIQRSFGGLTQTQFGLSTDQPVPADYDGDGKTDVAVFRPSDSNWYVWNTASNNLQVIYWGLGTDTLVPADYDGDGKTDIAIYRDGTWWIRQSASGIEAQQFGLGSDVPTNQVK